MIDSASIDAIAEKVVELLHQDNWVAAPKYVDVLEIARIFSLSTSFVYEHADDLGVVRVGNGSRARLRFDIDKVTEKLTACSTSKESKSPARPTPARQTPPRRSAPSGADADLLPITARRGLK